MAFKREVICAIPASAALDCLANPGRTAAHADIAEQNRDGMGFMQTMPKHISHLERLLAKAGELICVCDDTYTPGYSVAFYDIKNYRWLRLRTDPKKVAYYTKKYGAGDSQVRKAE